MYRLIVPICLLSFLCCKEAKKESLADSEKEPKTVSDSGVSLIVLGTVQDAGSPQLHVKRIAVRFYLKLPMPLEK